MDRLDIGDFRVAPLNKKCRELNRKYILPFGYTLNKLFTSNWSEKNYDGINFYDVFDRLLFNGRKKLMNLRKERLMKSQKNHLKRYFKNILI